MTLVVWAALVSGVAHTGVWGAEAHASSVDHVQAPPVGPGDGELTWGIQPASAAEGASRAAFSYELDPGSVIDDAVRITNFSEEPLTLKVSAHDAFNTGSGGYDVMAAGTTSVDVGSWVSVSAPDVTIPAREYVDVPFRTTVPSNATPGDHAGGIVASMQVESVDENGSQVAIDNRVGTRMYIRVNGPTRPALTVTSFNVAFEGEGALGIDGVAAVSFTVRNTGNLRVAATPTIAIEGPFGMGARSVTLDEIPELLPGGEYSGSVIVEDVRALGKLTGALTLVPTTPVLGPIEESTTTWAIPWRVVVMLVAVVVALVVRRRRRRAGDRAGDRRAGDRTVATEPAAAP